MHPASMPPLNPLRVFIVAAQRGSFSAAAKYLGVSQANVSRQVIVLEDFLGVPLFDRNGRNIRLTNAGRQYANRIGPCFDIFYNATQDIQGSERDSVVNLCVYPTFAMKWLIPRIAEFNRLYPKYSVRINTAIRPVDFEHSNFDVAIQMGSNDSHKTDSIELLEDEIDVICAPSLLKDEKKPLTPDDLNRFTLLYSKYRSDDWDFWLQGNDFAAPELDNKNIFDTSTLLYQAATVGMGLAIGQISILQEDIDNGILCRPFNKPISRHQNYRMIWPKDRHVQTKTRRFIDWTLDNLGKKRVFYPGEKQPDSK